MSFLWATQLTALVPIELDQLVAYGGDVLKT